MISSSIRMHDHSTYYTSSCPHILYMFCQNWSYLLLRQKQVPLTHTYTLSSTLLVVPIQFWLGTTVIVSIRDVNTSSPCFIQKRKKKKNPYISLGETRKYQQHSMTCSFVETSLVLYLSWITGWLFVQKVNTEEKTRCWRFMNRNHDMRYAMDLKHKSQTPLQILGLDMQFTFPFSF